MTRLSYEVVAMSIAEIHRDRGALSSPLFVREGLAEVTAFWARPGRIEPKYVASVQCHHMQLVLFSSR